MEDKHVINAVGTVCLPEADKEFNNWYDEECRDMRASLRRDVLMGVITHR